MSSVCSSSPNVQTASVSVQTRSYVSTMCPPQKSSVSSPKSGVARQASVEDFRRFDLSSDVNVSICSDTSSNTHSTQPARPQHPGLRIVKRKARDDVVEPPKRSHYGDLSKSRPTPSHAHSTQPGRRPEEPRLHPQNGGAPLKRAENGVSSLTRSILSKSAYCGAGSYCDGDLGGRVFHVSPEEEKVFQLASTVIRSKEAFNHKYLHHRLLGAGSFGSVYSGFRKADLLPVAIKHIVPQNVRTEKVICNGTVYTIFTEVALMLKAAGVPETVGRSTAVSLLDWYFMDSGLTLVMEKPASSRTLKQYGQVKGGRLEEHEAKVILSQLVHAAVDLHNKGVFHRSIKPDNILIQSNGSQPRVRLVGFGCGGFSTKTSYWSYSGTPAVAPPEWFLRGTYQARPTTVWQVGAVFYSPLSEQGCFSTPMFMYKGSDLKRELSKDSKMLLDMCLTRDPAHRATLEQLQNCPSLKETSLAPPRGHRQV